MYILIEITKYVGLAPCIDEKIQYLWYSYDSYRISRLNRGKYSNGIFRSYYVDHW